ncbi:hypothetical protein C4K38_4326 [Pseudomonas chlororaphis subsp. piscium]|nr:hypothetical protein C4K38_4326 [Pseudomonas chlororaphis subsp. piscium]AZC64601.1 hypothetical protein C4K33_4117 [Pseudomonas chlororaphis subsp. piscium]AZC70841.1 hypothetical protein C4K32_4187 [Pseudomonas chlororaphis subsp. piscium]KZO47975.1 hypothetical protein PCL1391_3838 [Pseudomonas chlororaphis subsp. piscium]SDS68967.1 hypothetical protein SAMN05216585_3068 [Pseudomonas chlororaphis]
MKDECQHCVRKNWELIRNMKENITELIGDFPLIAPYQKGQKVAENHHSQKSHRTTRVPSPQAPPTPEL